jgi:small conductance mechanosensitive channel
MSLQDLEEAFTGQPLTWEDVFAAVAVMAVGIAVSFLVGRLLRRYFGRPGGHSEQMAKLVGRAGQWTIVAIAVAWALSILGLNVEGLSIFLGIALLILAVGMKPLLESFAIGVELVSRPAFGVGDEIEVGDDAAAGEVIEITQRSVVLRRRDGARVHVPNTEVISHNIIVYSTDTDRRSSVEVKVAYNTDIDEADQVIRDCLTDIEGLSRLGSILVTSLDSQVEFSIRFWHESTIDAANSTSDLVARAVHRAFRDAGIEGAPSLEVALVDPVLPAGTTSEPSDGSSPDDDR